MVDYDPTVLYTAHPDASTEQDSHDTDDPKTVQLEQDKSEKGFTGQLRAQITSSWMEQGHVFWGLETEDTQF